MRAISRRWSLSTPRISTGNAPGETKYRAVLAA